MNVFEIHFLKLNYEVKLFPSRVYQMGYRHKDNRVHKYDRMNKIKSCIVWGESFAFEVQYSLGLHICVYSNGIFIIRSQPLVFPNVFNWCSWLK